MITSGIIRALIKFVHVSHSLNVVPFYWCPIKKALKREENRLRISLWILCFCAVIGEVTAAFLGTIFPQETVRDRVMSILFAGAFLYSVLVQGCLFRKLSSISACIHTYLHFYPKVPTSANLSLKICEKIIILCRGVVICHPFAVSSLFLRHPTKTRYFYSWIAHRYPSQVLYIISWLLHMWGLAFFASALSMGLIIVLTYTIISTHWLTMLLQFGPRQIEQPKVGKWKLLRPRQRFHSTIQTQDCFSSLKYFHQFRQRIQLYRQLQLINIVYNDTAGVITGMLISVCIFGHIIIIYAAISLSHVMPVPMTAAMGYYAVACVAFESVLVMKMGTVKDLTGSIVKMWLGEVSRRDRREFKCLMPFGIRFGGVIRKTTALGYLLLVCRCAKHLILIG